LRRTRVPDIISQLFPKPILSEPGFCGIIGINGMPGFVVAAHETEQYYCSNLLLNINVSGNKRGNYL